MNFIHSASTILEKRNRSSNMIQESNLTVLMTEKEKPDSIFLSILKEHLNVKECSDVGVNGKAPKKGVTEKDVDAEQLKMGIEVEKEHTKDPETAKAIALDHLAENPKYYSYLNKMEDEMRK